MENHLVELFLAGSAIFIDEQEENRYFSHFHLDKDFPQTSWRKHVSSFKRYPEHQATILQLPSPHHLWPSPRSFFLHFLPNESELYPLHHPSSEGDSSAPNGFLPLALQSISHILFFSAGVTWRASDNSYCKRPSPSSGALFSNEVYFIGSLCDHASPLYHYDPSSHQLHQIPTRPFDPPDDFPLFGISSLASSYSSTSSSTSPLSSSSLSIYGLIVVASIFRRTGVKYHDRCYRYVLCDTGHLVESIRLAAHEIGIHATVLHHYDDARIAQYLKIADVELEEGVMAVLALSSFPLPPSLVLPALMFEQNHLFLTDDFQEKKLSADLLDSFFHPLGITSEIQRVTSLSLKSTSLSHTTSALHSASDSSSPSYLPISHDPHDALLSGQDQHSPTLFSLLFRRRSLRHPSLDASIPLEHLLAILRLGFSRRTRFTPFITLHLAALRIDSLDAGIYTLDHLNASPFVLNFSHSPLSLNRLIGQVALNQSIIANSAAVLILGILKRTLLDEYAARGFREAFIEIGSISQRILLAALAFGWAARPVGAFFEYHTANLLKIDLDSQTCLHFICIAKES